MRRCRSVKLFQSTLPTRGATRNARTVEASGPISIHAPHTGSDFQSSDAKYNWTIISIHAPHTGSDPIVNAHLKADEISIHAPHTGSDLTLGEIEESFVLISIHAPHTGSDMRNRAFSAYSASYFNPRSPHGERRFIRSFYGLSARFQSTLPTRGATIKP